MQNHPLVRRFGLFALAGFLLCFSGCLQETTNGDVQIYTYPMWLSAVLFITGAGVAVAGYSLLAANDKLAYLLLTAGIVLGVAVTPGYFFYKTTVGPEEFHSRWGFMGMGSVHVKYAELTQIKLTYTSSRRGRRASYYLDCKTHDDREITLRMDDEGMLAAAPLFIKYARAKNVQILDHKGDPIMPAAGP